MQASSIHIISLNVQNKASFQTSFTVQSCNAPKLFLSTSKQVHYKMYLKLFHQKSTSQLRTLFLVPVLFQFSILKTTKQANVSSEPLLHEAFSKAKGPSQCMLYKLSSGLKGFFFSFFSLPDFLTNEMFSGFYHNLSLCGVLCSLHALELWEI